MLGGLVSGVDLVLLGAAFGVSVWATLANNPHPKNSPEYTSLRICRIAVALVVWGLGLGLIGMAFMLTAFILGVVSIVKGRTGYGVTVIVIAVIGAVLSPSRDFLSMMAIR